MELRSKVRVSQAGGASVTIPFDKILSQLSTGIVKIPFGDIRSTAPEFFAPGIESDRIQVTLPLNEILSRINPTLLMRRTAQRQMDIPDEITSPFDAHNLATLSVGNAKPVTPAAPRKAAPAQTVTGRGSVPAATPGIPASPIVVAPKVAAPQPVPFAANAPTAPVPAPFAIPTGVRKPSPAVATAEPQFIAAPSTEGLFITVALKAISEEWPEALRHEIVQQNLAESKLALPSEPVELALKHGRVAFPWKVLRSWIRPATAPMVSVHDAAELELPLKVIAPLFVARQRAAKQSGQRLAVDEAIPDLFFGSQTPEVPVAPAAPQSFLPPQSPARASSPSPAPFPAAGFEPVFVKAPVAPSSITPAIPVGLPVGATPIASPGQKPADTNYFGRVADPSSDTTKFHVAELARTGPSGTEFVTRYATPNEIVSRAAALDGVAGALIALPDGLMVASRIPSDLNGDTLAAFLPQLFAKMSSCTRELRMGELNNLNFTVGNVPWKIFRVNAIFFAAFGRAGEPMPSAQLAALAGELDRKNK